MKKKTQEILCPSCNGQMEAGAHGQDCFFCGHSRRALPHRTPGPWDVSNTNKTLITSNTQAIAETANYGPEWVSEANAAFIVRAVNAYEKNQKLINKAIQRLRDGDGKDEFMPECVMHALVILDKAIAKPEVK